MNDDNPVPGAGPRAIPPPPAAPPRITPPQPAPKDISPHPGARPAPEPRAELKQNLFKAAFVVALLGVAGLLTWTLTSLLATATLEAAKQPGAANGQASAAAPSASPRPKLPLKGVSPLDFRVGDCFKDFDPSATGATVVACTTEHSAQLVAAHRYPAGDSYPGRVAMKAKAREACQAAALTSKSNAYVLSYRLAYPSSDSWGQGDRRVDCYVIADAGNIIKASLLP